jgi:hypothetical protein
LEKFTMSDYDVKTSIDVIWGIDAIAAEIKRNRRQTHYALTRGEFAPAGAKLVCSRWCVSRRRLREFFEAPGADAAR